MPDDPKSSAVAGCDDALRDSVGKISAVLMNALISAATDQQRQTAIERARRGIEVSKETHATMKGLVNQVF